jgi:hypothetical protein
VKILTFILISAGLSVASASTNSLVCNSKPDALLGIQLTANQIWIGPGGMTLYGVTATVTDPSTDQTAVGRAQYLENDANYKPRKYKDTVRFQLYNLVDTESFGAFRPINECDIHLMIPRTAGKKLKFRAPTVVNCEQTGFSQTLACEINENK